MTNLSVTERILGGLWGAVVGDALGVPVEFQSREQLRQNPVQDMRGYGTYHQPDGTWSDDSSLMLCTVESLEDGFDTGRLGMLFVRWLNQAHWTPWQEVFDVGGTTRQAINRLSQGVEPEQAGLIDENSNGNGSLMRILPGALRYFDSLVEALLDHAHQASALTHRRVRSQMACGFYCAMVSALLKGPTRMKRTSRLSGQRSQSTKDHRIPEACVLKDLQRRHTLIIRVRHQVEWLRD